MDTLKQIKSVLNPAVDDGILSFGAFIACKDGKEMFNYSYGYQDLENKIPYSDKTILRAFSCTKTFTALATFKCIELGLFKLDDPLSKYFPSFKNPVVSIDGKTVPAKREIMIKDLLDMRAGLTYPEPDSDTGRYAIKIDAQLAKNELTTLEFVEKLGSSPLLFSPGENYHYSYCADVLGGLIAKTSGMSLRDFFKKYIFTPLGLKETDFFVEEKERYRIAKGYVNINGKLEAIPHHSLGINTTGEKNNFESGGAGLFMTMKDFNRFAQCLVNKTEGIISESYFQKMINPEYSTNPTVVDNGYTYYNLMRHLLRPEECQQECSIGEFGWDGMLGTYIIIDPINKITFIAGVQSFDAVKWDIVYRIKDIVFKDLKNIK